MLWSLGKEVCSLLGSGIVPLDQQQQLAVGSLGEVPHGGDLVLLVFDPRPGTGRIPGAFQAEIPLSSLGYGGVSGLGREINLLSFTPTLGLLLGSGLCQRQDGQSQRCLCGPGNNTEPTDVPGEMSALFVHPCPSSAAWEQPRP